MSYYYGWRPYVPVAERRRKAAKAVAKLKKKGEPVAPVVISGRTIARTFWGKAWCDNLERYSDFANRLPRGRTYVRNGSVLDLQIAPAKVSAVVVGSQIYHVGVEVTAVPKARWAAIRTDCAGAIDSLVELLQGRFSKAVMERICRPGAGLFPHPAEISFTCTCPDWASMCKHVAAVLYGVGARLDERPELLFLLRKVDQGDLIATAGAGVPLAKAAPSRQRVLEHDDLAGLFGLDLASAPPAMTPKKRKQAKPGTTGHTGPALKRKPARRATKGPRAKPAKAVGAPKARRGAKAEKGAR